MTKRFVKEIDDLDDIARDLMSLDANFGIVVKATRIILETTIGGESKEECPVETGTLRRTYNVSAPEITGGKTSIRFGYGTGYAIFVHENLNAFHKPPTKAKFLEDPVNRHVATILQEIADVVDRLLVGAV